MKALILVGGEATRLRPLTCNTPKAMVPVVNMPFLEHVIHHLHAHQVQEIVLALGFLSQPMQDYFADGSRFGVRLIHVLEDTPMGTAGAVKNAEKYLDESFFVLNGDIFTDLDFSAMRRYHLDRGARVTISLFPVEDPTAYGLIETTPEGRVTRFLEKPSWDQVTTNNINAGTYILEPEVLSNIPAGTKYSFERQLFPRLLQAGVPIFGYESPGYWIDIGTPAKYLQLNCDILTGKCAGYKLAEEVQIGQGCSVHSTAEIKAPVLIGERCVIGRGVKLTGPVVIGAGCVIPENAVIEGSVVWQNVRFGERVNLKHSIVANDCLLDAGCLVEDSVISDNVNIACGCKLEPASKVLPGTCVDSSYKGGCLPQSQ